MAKNIEQESPSINLLGAGTTIKGDITSNGDIRIDGTLVGSVHSKGKVVIGTTGNVEGEVNCQNADISGTIKANIHVAELLSLKATAKLDGEVVTNKLAIEPGAVFCGSCSMSNGAAKEFKLADIESSVKVNELKKATS
ncbi:MAG TPA: polymer-forming cytoskeletal protein [Bacteroidales bacterium]|mgnify:FL=1|nr:polymer-forming cytoskeletal protein [Bacteroidales bacterium]